MHNGRGILRIRPDEGTRWTSEFLPHGSRCRSSATITFAVIASERGVSGLLLPIWPRTSQIKRLIAPLLSLSTRSPPLYESRSHCSTVLDAAITARNPTALDREIGLRPSPLKILIKSSTRSTCGAGSSRGKSNHLI